MSKRGLWIAAAVLSIPLIALLLYSYDRTAEILATFEGGAAHVGFIGLTGDELGGIAAAVIELSIVGLVVGLTVASLLPEKSEIRTTITLWGRIGIGFTLTVMVVINLIIGGLRGWHPLYDDFQIVGLTVEQSRKVTTGTWILVNTVIPFLIYALTEIIARIVKMALLFRPSGWKHDMEQLETARNTAETEVQRLSDLLEERETTMQQQQTLLEQQAIKIADLAATATPIDTPEGRTLGRWLLGLNEHGLSYRTLESIFDISPAQISRLIRQVKDEA